MRLKADLSLPNSQHFTTWNKITQGSRSACSKLHTPPRQKASGWNGLKVQHDCISQVRSCWRWFSALSQQSVAWYRLRWKWCRAPCLNKSLGKHFGWESSPDTYSLCSRFHISTKDAATSLWGSLPYSALNIGIWFCLAFMGIMQNEFGKMREKWMSMSLFQACAL